MRAKNHTLFWTRRQWNELWTKKKADRHILAQVSGQYVDIADYLRSFVYYLETLDIWYVCELHTGLKYAQGDTRKQAIEIAKERISKQGRSSVLKTILIVNRHLGKIPKPYKYKEEAIETGDRSLEGWTDLILNNKSGV